MADKHIKEGVSQMNELMRRIISVLIPEEDFDHINDTELKKRLYGRFPKCFISLRRKEDGGAMGRSLEPYLLPICNRYGIVDPKIIKLSMNFVKKLMSNHENEYEINDLQKVLNSLQYTHSRYGTTEPHPPSYAGKKAFVTRVFGNIRKHLNAIRNGE